MSQIIGDVIWLNRGGLIKPVLAPSLSWYKGTTEKKTITEISLVDSYTSTGSETESWDASAAGNGSVMAYIDGTKLILAGNGCGKIFANADSSYAFGGNTSSTEFSSLTTVTGMELFDTSRVTNMNSMFYDCIKLTSLDVSNFDTSKVTNMSHMFENCSKLTSLDVSNFNTANVTDMNNMFGTCEGLTSLDVSNFNTSNVTDMNSMFNYCRVTSLDLSNFDTANVTNMNSMFGTCSKLTSLDVSNFNTANVTDMRFMFYGCSNLTSLDCSNWNTANVTDMRFMFYGCSKLTTIYASDRWTTANVTSSSNMFKSCSSLVGAISYVSNKVDATYANYTTGYFTYKAAPTS